MHRLQREVPYTSTQQVQKSQCCIVLEDLTVYVLVPIYYIHLDLMQYRVTNPKGHHCGEMVQQTHICYERLVYLFRRGAEVSWEPDTSLATIDSEVQQIMAIRF